ncbi:DivIVA domain-containing protein [Clostridium paraputrificum]|uniref:Cell division protein DivIVA n=1 Tax=Clostridium paraputrificum TaxID=29363 RepID=A0A1B8RT94_9CLOT|nr:DivIVA domain-containing protein [Clostridium paraputrificum]OBY12000.1 cell division protein DivIVA [Clostridium paraputrificum]
MKLTPMDINNKEFKRGLRGYNPEEVDEFLDEVVENYEELYKDNSKLREKVTTLTEQIEHYSKIESTIQNTLVLAQNAADQAKSSAEKEAELVVKNANETAQRIVDKAHADVIQINDEYDRVKQEFIKFRAKFRNFINTQLETFDDLEKDVTKNYNISTPVEDEAAIDSEVQFNEESFKTIEEDILTDNIDEIKSFFASKED